MWKETSANEAQFWDCCRNMGSFSLWCRQGKALCERPFALHRQQPVSTLPIRGKFSAGPHACVVCVNNVTSALYCAINNYIFVIRVPFVATCRLARRWMCDSPQRGVREDVCSHIRGASPCSCNVCEILGTNYCIPKRWPMGPFQQSLPPPRLKPLVTPLLATRPGFRTKLQLLKTSVLWPRDDKAHATQYWACVTIPGSISLLCLLSPVNFTPKYLNFSTYCSVLMLTYSTHWPGFWRDKIHPLFSDNFHSSLIARSWKPIMCMLKALFRGCKQHRIVEKPFGVPTSRFILLVMHLCISDILTGG